MSTPAKLRIVLGEDNCVKLTFPSGIPDSVDSLKLEIQKQCGVEGEFRLQYMDNDFDQFMDLTSTADIQDKSTVKVIMSREQPTQSASHCLSAPFHGTDDSSADTDILSSSSSESTTSTSSLRCQGWPLSFPIPLFTYEVDMQLSVANQKFLAEGRRLRPNPKLKSDVLDALALEIIKYTPYPSSAQLDDVAEALIIKHPCLKEQGSVSGFYGWKISLKYKIGNYHTRLRGLGCPELSINSMKNRNMVSAEFMHITTIPLVPKFMSQLDHYSEKMLRVFCKKGGAAGHKIAEIVAAIYQNDSIAKRRDGSLQALAVYLSEDPAKSENPDEISAEMEQMVIGIYVIKYPGADADQAPEDIGIIVEGVQVLQGLKDVANVCALLFGIIYDLNLSYPPDLRFWRYCRYIRDRYRYRQWFSTAGLQRKGGGETEHTATFSL
ncbi:hypothetical protein L3Q82_002010 [Scortum barcoo]|uniref:Uncharacterized protein n=1 Tax=Scortum barcoo TaxID=214431 RepID=A0ACB8W1T9_9TELE|nr:hypothetical protein L3Q82_002010 [Scortum barcoo]